MTTGVRHAGVVFLLAHLRLLPDGVCIGYIGVCIGYRSYQQRHLFICWDSHLLTRRGQSFHCPFKTPRLQSSELANLAYDCPGVKTLPLARAAPKGGAAGAEGMLTRGSEKAVTAQKSKMTHDYLFGRSDPTSSPECVCIAPKFLCPALCPSLYVRPRLNEDIPEYTCSQP